MSRRLTAALFVFALFPAASLYAQQQPPDTFRLSDIVVTATRLPASRDAVPAAVTVLQGEDLRVRGVRFVADALRAVPGVAIARNGSTGAITSAFIRGGEADYVQVLIDGVQVNEPGGAYDFGQLTTDNIERIEIVRGPAGVLYGSDAVTGVVQIFTRRGTGATTIHASASAGGGSRVGAQADGGYGTTAWDASLTGAGERAEYSLAASLYDSEGAYAFNNGYDNRTLSGRLRITPRERTDAAFSVRFTDDEFHFPTDGAGALADQNQFSTRRSLALGFDAGTVLDDRVELRLALGLHRFERVSDDQVDGPADTLGAFASFSESHTRRGTADLRANIHAGSSVLTLGGEREWQRGESEFRSESQFGPFSSDTDDRRGNSAGYVQLVTAPWQAFTLTVGGRAEDNERFGSFFTYRAGINYRAPTRTVLRAAVGTAFREPTFFENFAQGFARGNPDLEPEHSRSRELGVEQRLARDHIALAITAFDQRFSNLIQYTGAPPRPQDPNYFNVGVAVASGLELTARFASASLEVTGGYTYLETEVVDEGYGTDRSFLEGRRLLRRPRHSGSIGARYSAGITTLGMDVQHVGGRDDLDFSDPLEFAGVRVTLPAYTTVDLSGELQVLRRDARLRSVVLTAALRNALNERYAEIRNFPAPRRTIMLGLRAAVGL